MIDKRGYYREQCEHQRTWLIHYTTLRPQMLCETCNKFTDDIPITWQFHSIRWNKAKIDLNRVNKPRNASQTPK